MGAPYASTNDVIALWKPLTAAELERCSALLPIVSDLLRQEAHNRGRNLDQMIIRGTVLQSTVKAVTVDVVSRVMRQDVNAQPVSQESQSALGYSWSGTYAIPGGGIAGAIMRNDLKRLGLLRQRIGGIEIYDLGNHGPACS